MGQVRLSPVHKVTSTERMHQTKKRTQKFPRDTKKNRQKDTLHLASFQQPLRGTVSRERRVGRGQATKPAQARLVGELCRGCPPRPPTRQDSCPPQPKGRPRSLSHGPGDGQQPASGACRGRACEAGADASTGHTKKPLFRAAT